MIDLATVSTPMYEYGSIHYQLLIHILHQIQIQVKTFNSFLLTALVFTCVVVFSTCRINKGTKYSFDANKRYVGSLCLVSSGQLFQYSKKYVHLSLFHVFLVSIQNSLDL